MTINLSDEMISTLLDALNEATLSRQSDWKETYNDDELRQEIGNTIDKYNEATEMLESLVTDQPLPESIATDGSIAK